jgi:hypothetical protein
MAWTFKYRKVEFTAPPWGCYFAVNGNGEAWFFSNKPVKDVDIQEFIPINCGHAEVAYQFLHEGSRMPGWSSSLKQKPFALAKKFFAGRRTSLA